MHDHLSIQIGGQSILHEHFSDQKKDRSISNNQKIDLRNRPFLPSGFGRIEYAPHVPRFLIIRHFLRCLDVAYAIRPYRDTEYVIFHNHFSDQKKGRAVSHNSFSIQIKGQYILHRSLFDQKEGHAVFHELCFDSGKAEYALQDYILDRKY